ncbi:RICIN domain-containing protein [Hamadaea sp. NPDC050747]|uniref:RICIN domain-containing protein n=1 Tax=Hamadaea sp. NPDC050747 TaxID=3155789 RepID=UPI0033E717DA
MNRWIRSVTRAGLGLVTLAASLVMPATAASANYVPAAGDWGPYYIVNNANHRCLDAAAQGNGANGTRIQIWDCYPPTQHNQMWYLHWLTDDSFEVINDASGTCLDAPAQWGGVDGTPLQLWDCYPPTQYNQMWSLKSMPDGGRRIQGVQSNRALYPAGDGNGSTVQLLYVETTDLRESWTLVQY